MNQIILVSFLLALLFVDVSLACWGKSSKYLKAGYYPENSFCWTMNGYHATFNGGNLVQQRDAPHQTLVFNSEVASSTGNVLAVLNGDVQILDSNHNKLWHTNTGYLNQEVGFGFNHIDGFMVMAGCNKGEPRCIHLPRFLGKYWGYYVAWKSRVEGPCYGSSMG